MIKKELGTFKNYITQKAVMYGHAVCTWEFVKKLVYVPASLEEMKECIIELPFLHQWQQATQGSVVGNVISVCRGT